MSGQEDVQRALGRIEGKLAGIEQRLDGIHTSKRDAHARLDGRIDDLEKAQEIHAGNDDAHGARPVGKAYDRWINFGALAVAVAALFYSIFGGGRYARSAQAQEVPTLPSR